MAREQHLALNSAVALRGLRGFSSRWETDLGLKGAFYPGSRPLFRIRKTPKKPALVV